MDPNQSSAASVVVNACADNLSLQLQERSFPANRSQQSTQATATLQHLAEPALPQYAAGLRSQFGEHSPLSSSRETQHRLPVLQCHLWRQNIWSTASCGALHISALFCLSCSISYQTQLPSNMSHVCLLCSELHTNLSRCAVQLGSAQASTLGAST